MNCSTCKFWSAHTNGNIGTCDLPDWLGYNRKTHKNDELKETDSMAIFAYADDDSNMQVELQTGKDFGCLKHTPTEYSKLFN